MGGIGKTELALQYGYREWKKETYPGGICWLNVAESDPGLSILVFARQYLKLTPPEEGGLGERVAYCWRNWLAGEVLIIFDDVRDYEQIKPYLPPREDKRFKVLITTRCQYLSATVQLFQVEVLEEKDALDLLRSYVIDGRIDRQIEEAKALCRDLGYLPLALELVARLLRRREAWTVRKIREKLAENGLEDTSLTKHTRFDAEMTAERGVKAAFDLSWQELDNEPDIQKLALSLSLFALAPFPKLLIDSLFPNQEADDIEEWLTDSLVHLSLVQSLGNEWYELHPLIHRYLRDKLAVSEIADTAKKAYCSAMVKVAKNIPDTLTLENIEPFDLVIPHLEIAAEELPQGLENEDLIWLFTKLGRFYDQQGLYFLAEPYYTDCLTFTQQRLGENHPHVATSLNNLAVLYLSQGRYAEAEPLYLRSLSIREQQLAENHPDVAISLNNLAELYRSQGRYPEAESLYIKSLAIDERIYGDKHHEIAIDLNNLALLYYSQGRYPEAEPLYLRSLSILEQQLGENYPDVATSLNNLARLYESQGRYSEAEPLYRHSLTIREQQLGKNHPDVAQSFNNLAGLYYSQGRYLEAESLYIKSLAIDERIYGDKHHEIAIDLNNLALLYYSQGRYSEAEPLYVRSLSIREQQLGENHPDVAASLNNLALLSETQGKLEDAERLAQRALRIYQTTLGNDHPNTLVVLLTVKVFQMMMFLGCDKQTLIDILQAIAQANDIPELNTETMLMLLEVIATDPELLQSLREAFTE